MNQKIRQSAKILAIVGLSAVVAGPVGYMIGHHQGRESAAPIEVKVTDAGNYLTYLEGACIRDKSGKTYLLYETEKEVSQYGLTHDKEERAITTTYETYEARQAYR
jgi:hypothetical protein